jgi:hypothetical protein
MTWTRDNTTPTNYARDSFDCKHIARATALGGSVAFGPIGFVAIVSIASSVSTHNAQQGVFNDCMAARGYSAMP